MRIEQRVYISDETDVGRPVMVPDLRIAYRPGHEGSAFVPGGGTAVEVAEPIEAITMIEEEIRESYIEIVDRVDRSVVTVIEILSPTNKVAGSRGRESYDRKRLEVMKSPTSLVEIDLLRTGLPIPVYGGIPPHEYLVHVSRGGQPPRRQALADPAVSEAAGDQRTPQARGRIRGARSAGCSEHGLRSRRLRSGARLSG